MVGLCSSVIGFNTPRVFEVLDDTVFVPAAGGVVVTDLDGVSSFWQPTDGLHEVHTMALSSQQVLCLAEKRSAVALLFFDAQSLTFLYELPKVTSVAVRDLRFSPDATQLLALCVTPTNTVKVFAQQRGGRYALQHTVTLEAVPYTSVLFASFHCGSTGLVVVHECGLNGFALRDSGYVDCLSVEGEVLSCAAVVNDGVVCGTPTGSVLHVAFLFAATRTVAAMREEQGVTSLVRTGSRTFVGTGSGHVFALGRDFVLSFVLSLGSAVQRIVASGDAGDLIVGADDGLYLHEHETEVLRPLKRRFGAMQACHALAGAEAFVCVCLDGSFAVCNGELTSHRLTDLTGTVTCSCLLSPNELLIAMSGGTVACYDVREGLPLWTWQCAEGPVLVCQSDGEGRVMLYSGLRLHFLHSLYGACVSLGALRERATADVSVAVWLPKEGAMLVGCCSGELCLVRMPASGGAGVEHPAEKVVEATWRLDLPFADVFPCHVEADFINIVVHSLDKETKLYVLERRRDTEGKALRPLFLMRDHEKVGSALLRVDATRVLSLGRDGRALLRDIAHYQAKQTPIPPSKEKRPVLMAKVVRPFYGDGVTVACGVGEWAVCGGNGSVVVVMPMTRDEPAEWREPQWVARRCAASEAVDVASETDPAEDAAHEATRAALLGQLEALREEWQVLAAEAREQEIPIEALLPEAKQQAFREECEQAIFEMHDQEYYDTLLHEYKQDVIKRRCIDTMEVGRTKIVNLVERGCEVHNFHILKETVARQPLHSKVLFLRRMQAKMGRGYSFGSLRQAPAVPNEVPDDQEHVSLMLNPLDCFTPARCALQMLLLQAYILHVKSTFNRRYVELRERKQRELTLMEERAARCAKIGKQLGEPAEGIFAPYVDREENPASLFEVRDEELPEEVQALLDRKVSEEVLSPVNEAALKLWMDGLEKEVEVVRVTLAVPDFADDTRDSFVPPDERTEEQVKRMEAYEKQLEEQTLLVNTRKEALRNERAALQKQSHAAAASFDEALAALRQTRLTASERIHRAELYLAKLHRHMLRTPELVGKHAELEAHVDELRRHDKFLDVHVEGRTAVMTEAQRALDAVEAEDAALVADLRGRAPFTDAAAGDRLQRRFARWKRRLDEGKATAPDPEKPAEEVPDELWMAFCGACDEALVVKQRVSEALAARERAKEECAAAEADWARTRLALRSAEEESERLREGYVRELINTEGLYELHQGQIQDERARSSADFASSALRWTADVAAHNELIFASDAESVALLRKIVGRQKSMKALKWEKERLLFDIGTREMELRQLHTLQVTRQMQEWLCDDAGVSEDRTLEKLGQQAAYVNEMMGKKVRTLRVAAGKMKAQVAERVSENEIVDRQRAQLSSTVQDIMTVKGMVDSDSAGAAKQRERAREIYLTSELEELARCQQEELFRLKKDVDRLREKTFPSFAVVAKRRV